MVNRDRVSIIALIACAAGLFGGVAHAQDASRNVSVRERPKPEYDAVGIHVGAFRLFPSANLSESYSSNVFGEETGARSDTDTVLGLGLALNSNWNNHALNFGLTGSTVHYNKFGAQDATDVSANMSGRLDVSRNAHATLNLERDVLHEAIAITPSNAVLAKPVAYDETGVGLQFSQDLRWVAITAEGRSTDFNYRDGVLANNTPLDEDDRDVKVNEALVRADFSFNSDSSVFLGFHANEHRHDLNPPAVLVNRDSSGYEVVGGVKFDLTHLIRGEIGAGMLSQKYDQPGVADVGGIALHSKLEWFPDPLVTVTVAADRNIGDAGFQGAAGLVTDAGAVQVDYEYRRNVIFGLSAGESRDDYRGIDRVDIRRSAGLSGDYALNRDMSLFLQVSRYSQSSSGAQSGREFDIDQATFGLRLHR